MAIEISGLAAKVAAGERVTTDDARALLGARDLIQLGMLAAEARARRQGTRVTFVRVCDVPLADAEEAELSLDTAGELRLVGAPSSADAAVEAVRTLVARAGAVPVTGFALHHLQEVAGQGAGLATMLSRLKAAGLAAVAEATVDRVTAEALAPLARTGLPLARLVVERPTAIDDAPAWLADLRRLQQETSAIHVLAPLARRPPDDQPTTGYDDVRVVALARVLLDNVDHIQTDWSRAGAKLAQITLMFGADDLDHVPVRDAEDLGPRRTALEEVRRNIRAASLDPVERNARFEGIAR